MLLCINIVILIIAQTIFKTINFKDEINTIVKKSATIRGKYPFTYYIVYDKIGDYYLKIQKGNKHSLFPFVFLLDSTNFSSLPDF